MAFRCDLDTLILGVLHTGERHGYEIARRVRELSETALAVGDAQLYPALHRLERDGLVSARWESNEGKPPRKIYSLTGSGKKTLEKQRKEWERFAGAVNLILNLEASRG